MHHFEGSPESHNLIHAQKRSRIQSLILGRRGSNRRAPHKMPRPLDGVSGRMESNLYMACTLEGRNPQNATIVVPGKITVSSSWQTMSYLILLLTASSRCHQRTQKQQNNKTRAEFIAPTVVHCAKLHHTQLQLNSTGMMWAMQPRTVHIDWL